MRPLNAWLLVVATGIIFLSCQKEINDSDPPPDPSVPVCRLTKWIQGSPVGGPDDTVYVFKYDQQGKMHVIIDSGYNDDSRILKYESGRLTEIFYVEKNFPTDTFPIAKYTYTATGLLKEVESYFATQHKYVFHYGTDSLPTSLTHYRENFSTGGTDTIQYRYQWQNGNMMKAERLYSTGWETEAELSYSTVSNQLKFIALLDISEEMEFRMQPFMFFNKNMEKTYKAPYGTVGQYYYAYDAEYTQDSTGKIIYFQQHLNDTGVPFGLSRRHLFYTCK